MKGKHRASTCVLVSVAFLVVALATITSSSSCSSQTSESEWLTLNGNSSSSMSELLNSNSSSSSSSHSSRDTGKKDGILHWEGSFLQQLLFFSPPLTGFESIWKVLVIWNLLGFALIYLVCGIVAGCVFKNHNLAIVIPLVSAIVGSVAGFFCGAILSICVALIYISGPFEMYWYMGLMWGLGMPIAYTIHSFIRFVFN